MIEGDESPGVDGIGPLIHILPCSDRRKQSPKIKKYFFLIFL